jgi:long-chain fatty acid transport protein
MLGDFTWNGWSSVKQLTAVSAVNGAQVAAPLRYNMENSWRVGLGAKYQYNDAWNLRFGIAYDQTPVPNAESRTMTVPDSDRTWLSFGARYKLSPQSSVDMGYAHLFFKNTNTNRAVMTTTETATLQTVRGNFKTHANLLSVQYNHSF